MRPVAVAVLAVAAGEVHARQHPAAECGVPGVDPGVDHRDGDPLARQRLEVAGAGPHLVRPDGLRRNVASRAERLDPAVPGERIDRVVGLQHRQLAGIQPHDGAAAHRFLDAEVVFPRQRLNLRRVALDDDVDRLGAGRQMIRQVFAEAREALRHRRLDGGGQQEQRDERRDDDAEGDSAGFPRGGSRRRRTPKSMAEASVTRCDPPSVRMVCRRPSRIRL